jgi:hypothetical protein
MALQVRRGTNAERLGITPAEGELLYTTDTKQLYIGDGTTAGGTTSIAGTIDSLLADTTPQLGGILDLNNFDITGNGNININGTITASGNINLGDGVGSDLLQINAEIGGSLVPNVGDTNNLGSQAKYWNEAWINQLTVDSQITAERVQADIIADDSTVVFNAATGQINASGTFTGTVTGTLDGDVTGSVFGDDSTPLVDGVNNTLSGASVTTNNIIANLLNIGTNEAASDISLSVNSKDETSIIRLARTSDSDISSSAVGYGRLLFGRNDAVAGSSDTCSISGFQDGMALSHDTSGSHLQAAENFYIADGVFAFGTFTPAANSKVDVAGNLHITGGYTQFGSLTSIERDTLTAANGMVIYNTTNNKFEGYQNSGWINLDNGLAAS